eukprot:12812805-Ditylum_brightwellii.AAC.1
MLARLTIDLARSVTWQSPLTNNGAGLLELMHTVSVVKCWCVLGKLYVSLFSCKKWTCLGWTHSYDQSNELNPMVQGLG